MYVERCRQIRRVGKSRMYEFSNLFRTKFSYYITARHAPSQIQKCLVSSLVNRDLRVLYGIFARKGVQNV